jgi:N-acetylmuramoyl-L-alanine amidase
LSFPLLRRGDEGAAVRELQERLLAAGHHVEVDGHFGEHTEVGVRAFQEARCIRVDGIAGPQTWAHLIAASVRLGDRLLYLRREMLRGDDVAELQRRMNALGFDAGREDGILGPATERAIRQFQRNAGLTPDGVFGPATRKSLTRLDALAAGSVAAVREREHLRRGPHQLTGRTVYLAVEPGLAVLGGAVAKGLAAAGAARVATATSGEDDSTLAAEANRFEAHCCLAIRSGDDEPRCAYFATTKFRSEAGFRLAQHLDAELTPLLGHTDGVVGKSYPLLRETRMPAVICEIVPAGDAAALQSLVASNHEIAEAIVRGTRRGVERPLDAP